MGLRRLVATAALLLGCADVAVIHAAPEPEARRAVAALTRAGVAAQAAPGERGFAVTVAEGDVARAVVALQEVELPRREEPGFAEAWGERSLVATAAEERARTAQATSGELARSLEALDGVLDARVHLALPAEDASGEAPRRPTASVLVRHEAGAPPVGDAQVKALVANAVAGMRAEDVAVVFVARARRAPAATAVTTVAGVTVAARDAGRLRWMLGALVVLALAGVTAAGETLRRAARRRAGGAAG